jgi:hypothetical protein
LKIRDLNKLIEAVRSKQDELLRTKGNDYTMANEDRCHNFKQVAAFLGITPMQAWGVYYLKHVFAVCTFVQKGEVASEDIFERFVDANNYAYLGLALIEDERNEATARKLATHNQAEESVKKAVLSPVSGQGAPLSHDAAPEYTGGRTRGQLWPT